MKTIATHRAPDADALAASWLAQRFLFKAEKSEIVFVARSWSPKRGVHFDCAVDIGCTHDELRLLFDHKPPALPDRNLSCAARLVWKYLQEAGEPIAILLPLIKIVHEGDRRPPLRVSPALARSRRDGFHALISRGRREKWSDELMYQRAESWLDGFLFALDSLPKEAQE